MITADKSLIIAALKKGGLVGLPTETVYGLAGNAFDLTAIQSIYALKKRPATNPLIIHIGSVDQLDQLAINIPKEAQSLIDAFWPGPLTLIFDKSNRVLLETTAGQETVAVRMPKHAKTLDLLQSLDFPLVAPSANPYMSVSPTCAEHVDHYFPDLLVYDGGPCEVGLESTIVGFTENGIKVYRLGSISAEELEFVTGIAIDTSSTNQVVTPGMAKRHYSPKCSMILTENIPDLLKQHDGKRIGVIAFQEDYSGMNISSHILSSTADLAEAGRKIYALLIQLDALELDLILVEKLPEIGIGKTINERMSRAAVN
jgi:L-threonylcarbamoyladenylate synthase